MISLILPGLVCAVALLLAMTVALATGVGRLRRMSGLILGPAAVFGLFLYCGAYLTAAVDVTTAVTAVLHGLLSTCVMFVGRPDFAAAAGAAPWFRDSAPLQLLFWLTHLSAFFVSASAILSTLGKKLVQTLRLYVLRTDEVYLFYGLHAQSVALGQDIRQNRGGKFIYIAPEVPDDLAAQVLSFGGMVLPEPYLPGGALNKTLFRLHGVKPGGRAKQVTVLALDEAENVNLAIAGSAAAYFKNANADPRAVRILLRSRAELDLSQMEPFRRKPDGPVYNVEAFCEAELSARVMIDVSPPCAVMQFDACGRAQSDFSALVLGFGQVGQHALRHLTMNGQFVGSAFSAVAVDRQMDSLLGQFDNRYAGMRGYDIRFLQMDTRAAAFYALLDSIAPKLKYIVIALGTDEANYEAAADLGQYFKRMNRPERPVFLVNVCNKRYAARTEGNIRFFDTRPILYTGRLLLRGELDIMAAAVNYTYAERMPGHGTAREEWNGLSYFNRESSRASAAFIPAMLRIAGLAGNDAADAAAFRRKVSGELLEVMAQTEHLRWNAFHHAMGYVRMTHDEIKRRAAAGITPPHKDDVRLRHACIADWDDLDGLSDLIGGLLGKKIDYKAMDRDNVLQIPRTLGFAAPQQTENEMTGNR